MTTHDTEQQIRERHARATPGPLYVVQIDRECDEYSPQYYVLAIGPYDDDAADCFAFSHEICDRSDDASSLEANFELFAHAHADIAHLLSRIDELTAALAAERADVVRWLRAKEESWVNRGVVASQNEVWSLRDSCYDAADAISSAADAIERAEHKEKPNAKPE